MSKINLIMCVVMTFVLCIMTLGYVALQERIDVEVEANIDSTYRVEITDYSTVDIRLNNVEINTTNNNIKITKIGIRNGDIMLASSTKTFTVKIKLETATSSEQISTITVSHELTRLKGGTGSVVKEGYDASGCSGHSDYARSKIKEFLELTYINSLGLSDLKELEKVNKNKLINTK